VERICESGRFVLSQEWKSQKVMDGESGESTMICDNGAFQPFLTKVSFPKSVQQEAHPLESTKYLLFITLLIAESSFCRLRLPVIIKVNLIFYYVALCSLCNCFIVFLSVLC